MSCIHCVRFDSRTARELRERDVAENPFLRAVGMDPRALEAAAVRRRQERLTEADDGGEPSQFSNTRMMCPHMLPMLAVGHSGTRTAPERTDGNGGTGSSRAPDRIECGPIVRPPALGATPLPQGTRVAPPLLRWRQPLCVLAWRRAVEHRMSFRH